VTFLLAHDTRTKITHWVRMGQSAQARIETSCGMPIAGMKTDDGLISSITCQHCQVECAAEYLRTEDDQGEGLDTAIGAQLDRLAANFGVIRRHDVAEESYLGEVLPRRQVIVEDDISLRARLELLLKGPGPR
jgi:hypothetical protein